MRKFKIKSRLSLKFCRCPKLKKILNERRYPMIDDDLLNPNCSEAVYRLDLWTIKNMSGIELEILEDILGFGTVRDAIYHPSKNHFEHTEYFENTELDLFLDYFQIPADRTHWTVNATSHLDRDTYNDLMKDFCIKYKLPYIERYDDRYNDIS